MNEYVLVEFLALVGEDNLILVEKLRGIDYTVISTDIEYNQDEDDLTEVWYKVTAKISAADATVIKLQDQFLAERMRISYIPDELKDKYRR